MTELDYITDSTQLVASMNNILEDVINNVSNTLLQDFQRHLDDTIYAAPIGEYQRYYKNGGFYSGWIIDDTQSMVRSLVFDGSQLISPNSDMINSQTSHGGRNGEDIRDIIAAVLNDARYNDWYSHHGGAKYLTTIGNGYWDTYLANIDKKITKWLDEEFMKHNIRRT